MLVAIFMNVFISNSELIHYDGFNIFALQIKVTLCSIYKIINRGKENKVNSGQKLFQFTCFSSIATVSQFSLPSFPL